MSRIHPLVVAFSLLAFAGASYAQMDKKREGQSSRPHSEMRGDRASAGATQRASQMRASELIGKEVTNSQGEDLGEIKDIVVNLQDAQVHSAVLEFGGFLGLGEKQYVFPVSRLKSSKDGDKLVLNVDKDQLKDSAGFDKNRWPAMNDDFWSRVRGERQASAGASQSQPAKQARLMRASELMGKEVKDKTGKDVGEVQDLTVDLNTGRVRSVVLDLDDGGPKDVQPRAISQSGKDELVLDMSHAQPKAQPKKTR